ncbi:uncharacterized protein [Aegilops tauschii subsp. strangulata]|uniref:uncharacterized protein n=1 Tax=Aegilops tauschii subsp. strangulata TaxID=200361 RepID=UPI001ABC575F|nr:deoxyuridine 5'-triphosphate nucleotidohydrolase-like [Aegilops tauschii subsp. strangulata]
MAQWMERTCKSSSQGQQGSILILFSTGVTHRAPPTSEERTTAPPGLLLPTLEGVIVTDYRNSGGIVLFNNSETDFTMKPGDCITQMIVQVILTPKVAEVEDLDATVRRLSRWRTSMPPFGGC